MKTINKKYNFKRILLALPMGLVFNIAFAQTVTPDPYYKNLALVEGGNNPAAMAGGGSTAVGLYQTNQGALQAVGLLANAPGSWNAPVTFNPNPYGITNLAQFEANPAAQLYYAQQYGKQVYQEQQSYASQYLGQTVNGQVINQSGLLTCGYVLGVTGCHDYLNNGGVVLNNDKTVNQALTDNANARIANGSQFDSSAETGSFTAVAPGPGNVNIGAGQGNAAYAHVYCDPAIATAQYNGGLSAVASATLLAENGPTGYTFVDGNGVSQDANGSAAQNLITGPNAFEITSCVDRLLNNPFNIVFQPPNLSSILSSLENMACNQAQSLFSSITQPLTSSLQNTANLGGFYPGLGIGSLAGSINTSGSVGAGSGSGINITVGNSSVNTSLSQIYNGNLNLNNDLSTLGSGAASGLNIPSGFSNGLFGGDSSSSNITQFLGGGVSNNVVIGQP